MREGEFLIEVTYLVVVDGVQVSKMAVVPGVALQVTVVVIVDVVDADFSTGAG
jgi:hypothetical protein